MAQRGRAGAWEPVVGDGPAVQAVAALLGAGLKEGVQCQMMCTLLVSAS